MAEIKPFRAFVYNADKVEDLAAVMAPPYDVISPAYQDKLYSRHEYNIVRLILGKTEEVDNAGSDRYSRAAEELGRWKDEGVLKKDEKPAIYYYVQKYTLPDGSRPTRKGFIALSRLEEFGKGKIHAHERTLSGPKADRLKLMRACNANFSCIFSLYSEPGLTINKTLDNAVKSLEPIIDVFGDDGVENVVYRVVDAKVLEKVCEVMRAKTLFIADGHHRYETALNYRNLMREKNPDNNGDAPYNYVMMYFSNMDDEGMTIWPTHRVVHSVKGFNRDAFMSQIEKYFDIKEFEYNLDNMDEVNKTFVSALEESGKSKNAFGVHLAGEQKYYLITLKSPELLKDLFSEEMPAIYKNLDVTVLHELILSRILGISREDQEKQKNLTYVKSIGDAFEVMGDESNQIVFLLNPTRISQVRDIAEAGSVMPQKSTYFFPKLLSGLVVNLLDDDC
ncbi:MAG: DUF1015 domain-containing protein [Thermodesulfobacteriota bacterium]|nr:MAG: DUF1015 domain-containing protein [Thermodesulfobacteriota bacterium]